MWKYIISVTGNTASGTTTLTRRLSKLVGWRAVYSGNYIKQSPFFPKFLQEPARWAFHNQAFFIIEYTEDYQTVTESIKPKNQVLCLDYTIFELGVYTDAMREKGYLEPDEYQVLKRMLKLAQPSWLVPDLLIYLTTEVDVLMSRIRKRGRIAETNIERSYVEILQSNFEYFASSWTKCPVLTIDSQQSDFYEDELVKLIANQSLGEIER